MQAVEHLGYAPNSAAKNLRTLRTGKLLVTVPGHLQSVLLADPAGHRGRGAARGLRRAARRHAARRGARGALRADAEAQGGRRPDLPRPPAAEGSGGARPRDGAAPRAGRQRLRVQPAPRHPERAHRQREGRRRGDGSSLPARPPAHRHRHRPAGQPAQPRSPARRDGAGEAAARRARLRRDERRLLDRVGRRRPPSGCSGAREPPTAIFCFNDEMAMGAIETAQRRGLRVPRRPVGRRLRRHPLRAATSIRR